MNFPRTLVLPSLILALAAPLPAAAPLRFDFGNGPVAAGCTPVTSTTVYSAQRGYGLVSSEGVTAVSSGSADALKSYALAANQPFSFVVDLPEGNYDVSVVFGDPTAAASTAVKAEARRLIQESVATKAGQLETLRFTVNIRRPAITGGGSVTLNGREKGPPLAPDWNDQLSLEFNGAHPAIAALEIKEAKDAVTLYIAGDSTVTDQANEPWAGWGQILPRFFQPGIAVSNQAESGLALYSFKGQHRLEKVLSTMKKGDYLFIQFGHNDQKDKHPGAGPFTSYKDNLKQYVHAVREKQGIPVLVTSMERRRWKDGQPLPTLADYAEAVRQVGQEEHVPVIDLNTMSLTFYKALGPEGSTHAFVHYPANTFKGQDKALSDDTHHNTYGAYELARCVVEGIRARVPALAPYLRPDAKTFDPAKPDDSSSISLAIPQSPSANVEKPAGS